MADDDAREPIDLISDEIAERLRRGEQPTLDEYTERYPELANRLRRLFPLLLLMETASSGDGTESSEIRFPNKVENRELGDYRIVRELGRGGMGIVYEAEQMSLGRRVALKVLPQTSLLDSKQLQRFLIEARAAASLSHPGIVPVHEISEHNGTHFYAMQLIEGQGIDSVIDEMRALRVVDLDPDAPQSEMGDVARSFLSTARLDAAASKTRAFRDIETSAANVHPPSSSISLVAQSGSIDAHSTYCRNVARLGVQVAEALEYAHQHGILHRDIKPSNLLVDTTGKVFVADFGLAKAAGSEALTASGDAVGTLRYMGPERFRGWSDPRSDIYGLGATMYEMIALQPAFQHRDRARLVQKVLNEDPRPLRRVDSRVPRKLETIISKAMHKDPERRYDTAAQLAEDLRCYVDHRPIAARRTSLVERAVLWCQRNRWIASLGASVILSLTIGTSVSTWMYLETRDLADSLETEKTNAQKHLVQARIDEARLRRGIHGVGQRVRGLEALEEAARSGVTQTIRNEMVNALCLADLKQVGADIEGRFDGPWGFDRNLERYLCLVKNRDKPMLEIRNVQTDALEASLALEPGHLIKGGLFSPSGEYILLADDKAPELWRLPVKGSRSQRVISLPHASWSLEACEFSPDEKRLLAIIEAKSVLREYDLASGKELSEIPLPTGFSSIWGGASPDGRFIAVIVNRRSIHILDRTTGRNVDTLDSESNLHRIAWHPTGKLLAAGCASGEVHLWDLELSSVILRLRKGHDVNTANLMFQPGGPHILSSDWAGSFCLWNYRSGKLVLKGEGDLGSFSADGHRVAIKIRADRARVYEVVDPGEYRVLGQRKHNGHGVHSAAFSPDGNWLAAARQDGVSIIDQKDHRIVAKLEIGRTHWLAFDPGGTLLTSGAEGVHAWPFQLDASHRSLIIGPPRQIYALNSAWPAAGLSRDGSLIAVVGNGIRVLHISDGQRTQVLEGCSKIGNFFDFSPDNRWLVGGNWHGSNVPLWSLKNGKRVRPDIKAASGAFGKFTPDGLHLMIRDQGFLRLHHFQDGKIGAVLWQKPSTGYDLAMTPDGSIFSAKGSAHEIQLLDVNGRLLALLDVPAQPYRFSFDGSRLVGSHPEGASVAIWDLRKIRSGLANRGLDWDLPPLSNSDATPVSISMASVDLGRLAGKYDRHGREARANFALRISPGDPALLLERGRARLDSNKSREAESDLSLALDGGLDMNRGLAYLARGRCRANLGKPEEAISDWMQGLKLATLELSTHADLLFRVGTGHLWARRYKEALPFWNRYFEIDYPHLLPVTRTVKDLSHAYAHLRRGKCHAGLGLHDEALADFDRAISSGHLLEHILRERGRTYRGLGRFAEAIADYHRLEQMLPKDSQVKNALGWWYIVTDSATQDPEKALTLINEAIALEKTPISNSLNTRGVILYRLGKFQEAIADLKASVAGSEMNRVCDHLFLAMCHARLGRQKLSRKHWNLALSFWEQDIAALSEPVTGELENFRREAESTLRQVGVDLGGPK